MPTNCEISTLDAIHNIARYLLPMPVAEKVMAEINPDVSSWPFVSFRYSATNLSLSGAKRKPS